MSQAQFLLFLIALIPLINCLVLKLYADSKRLVNILSKLLPLLFFLHLIGLYNSLHHNQVYIEFLEAKRGLSLGFAVNDVTLKFLFLLNFIWLSFVFYSHRFLRLEGDKNINEFKLFFALIIALINLILISQNLLTTLFFYNCLVMLCHFFAVKFLHKKDTKFSYLFTFLIYLESMFFFLAIVATYKFIGRIDFAVDGILPEKLNQTKYLTLLILYLSGLFLSIMAPSYLIHRQSNFNPLIIYALFFLAYAFSSLYIFVKILVFIFGIGGFAAIILKVGFSYFEVIFLANLLISGVLLLFSKNLKSAFFYLFFHQFIFALFTIFIFALFDPSRVYLALFSFILSMTLVFFCISNLILYLERLEDKSSQGLFFDLKITSFLLVFALANLVGIAPGIGVLEKIYLAKILLKKKLFLANLIFLSNLVTLLIFSLRLIYQLFSPSKTKRSPENILWAKNIDFDSSLILSSLITAIAIVFLLILFPLITNFF